MQFLTFVTNCIARTLANMITTDYIDFTYEVGLMRQILLLIPFYFIQARDTGKLMQFISEIDMLPWNCLINEFSPLCDLNIEPLYFCYFNMMTFTIKEYVFDHFPTSQSS
jgi:hypothetical protein